MKRNELDSVFTNKVAQYIAEGFTINLDTMGSRECGEIGKIDMRKGDEVIRVLLASDYVLVNSKRIYTMKVGRNTDTLYGSVADTIWSEHLEVIEEHSWLVLNEGEEGEMLVAIGNAKELNNLCWQRLMYRIDKDSCHKFSSDAAKAIALKYIRRQPRMSNAKLEDITEVTRTPDGYSIIAKGKTFIMH